MNYPTFNNVMIGLILSSSVYGGGEQTLKEVTLSPISIEGEVDYSDITDAATEGTVTARQLANRPLLRPAEVLESVPGLIVTQHSGDGKANQYFLRGFSLDHGTDFYTTVEGMPTNLTTHAHGQGYNDLNFLIPELISSVMYKKGPYYATEGDFASTGSAHIHYADSLSSGIASVTVGSFGQKRFLNANAFDVKGGKLLYALEYFHNDGPWENPEGYQRLNGVVSYAKEEGRDSYKITAMGYKGNWEATNQVPLRAISSGIIGTYGSLDPSDGGNTHRYSLSGEYTHRDNDGTTCANAYMIDYGLDLFSNFTYYLNDAVRGDQFEQNDARTVIGGNVGRVSVWGLNSVQSYGFQLRNDAIRGVGLYNTQDRFRFNTISSDRVNVTDGALYYQNELTLSDKVRLIAGIRGDLYRFDVISDVNSADSAVKMAAIASPKLSFIFGPWADTELFLNSGYGFHSNDARGIAHAISSATPLVRTKGGEIGVRTRAVDHLQSSLALWMMDSDSELVFAGDTGGTEPTGPSRRTGIEWANYWTPTPWFILDADMTLSRARYKDPVLSGGVYVPEAIEQTVSIGAAVTEYDNYFGGLRLRYFGSRALIEDNSVRSKPSTLVNLKVGRHLAKNLDLSVDVYNLFDRKTYDIEYYYTSRLAAESTPIMDHMVHPGEPRSARLTLTYRY
ncbi:TonB-dependent receptor [Sulfuricurvum sp.]|uniref:TonB-dependent receptor n=1 Tax=Sulfuricurvum sp. TaxID=2025608 RepID=UPI003567B600